MCQLKLGVHWIKDKEFGLAIKNFLDKESDLINSQKNQLNELSPYKLS